MALGIGIGIGLSNTNHAAIAANPSSQQTLCSAIEKRQHVVITTKKRRHLVQPYLVTKYDGVITLVATIAVSDGRQRRGFGTRVFEVAKIESAEIVPTAFIPNAGFTATGDIVCSIELIENVDDALQALLGTG